MQFEAEDIGFFKNIDTVAYICGVRIVLVFDV